MKGSVDFRQKLGLSQAELARILDAQRSTLAMFEQGRRSLPLAAEAYLSHAERMYYLHVYQESPPPNIPNQLNINKINQNIKILKAKRHVLEKSYNTLSNRYFVLLERKAWLLIMAAQSEVEMRGLSSFVREMLIKTEKQLESFSIENVKHLELQINCLDMQINYWENLKVQD